MKKTITIIYGISVALVIAGTARAGAGAELSSQDKEYVDNVLANGKSDVQLGDMASKEAKSTELKALGSQVSSSEGQADDELKQMLDKKGVSTTTTSAMASIKSEGQNLEGVTGVHVDKDVAQGIVKNEKKNVAASEKEVADGQDTELRAWAAKELPIQEEHLKSAELVETTISK